MEIKKHFPIGTVNVEISGETLKVKYRYPNREQVRLIREESTVHGFAIATCKYCVEDIDGLTIEGKPLAHDRDGAVSDDDVMALYNNGLAIKLSTVYTELAPSTLDKKKFSSLPAVSEITSPSKTEAQNSSPA